MSQDKQLRAIYNGSRCCIADIPYELSCYIQDNFLMSVQTEVADKLIGLGLPLTKEEDAFSEIKSNLTCYPFQQLGNNLYFLTGLLPDVISKLKRWQLDCTCEFKESLPTFTKKEVHSWLRPHQVEAVLSGINKKRGLIQSPTGSGKAAIIGQIAYLLSSTQSVLITVPSKVLLYQMQKDLKELGKTIGYPNQDIGLVGDGHLDYKSSIVVCIPDTAISRIEANDWEFRNYLGSVGVLLGDEVHLAATPTYWGLARAISSRRYSLGFSATIWPGNGLDVLLKGIFGPLLLNIKVESMIEKGIILQPIFKFYKAPACALNPKMLRQDYSHWLYNHLYKILIVNNTARNNLIISLVMEYIQQKQGPIVVIVNKVGTGKTKAGKPTISHANILQSMFALQGLDVPVLHGQTPKKELELVLNQLRASEIPAVIAGPKLLTEGVNVPAISAICLAGAGSSDNQLIQRCGRALRTKEGKESPIIIDFLDSQSYFKSQSKSRMETAASVYGQKAVHIIE